MHILNRDFNQFMENWQNLFFFDNLNLFFTWNYTKNSSFWYPWFRKSVQVLKRVPVFSKLPAISFVKLTCERHQGPRQVSISLWMKWGVHRQRSFSRKAPTRHQHCCPVNPLTFQNGQKRAFRALVSLLSFQHNFRKLDCPQNKTKVFLFILISLHNWRSEMKDN